MRMSSDGVPTKTRKPVVLKQFAIYYRSVDSSFSCCSSGDITAIAIGVPSTS